jgi:DNA-directed RNA polymerase specialized sigma24 family protein
MTPKIDSVADALFALRDAPDRSASSLGWAWRTLDEVLARTKPLPPARDREDVRQRALLRVLRYVGGLEAETAASAWAWLQRVHRTAFLDHVRLQGRRAMDRALATTPRGGRESFIDTLPMPDESPPTHDLGQLDAALQRVLERVAVWLETQVSRPAKRAGDYRRAQVALLANVRGLGRAEICAELGLDDPPSAATLYKWVERGRETVLIPALEDWDDPIAAGLRQTLTAARRGDAGRPRPGRRLVSPVRDDSSGGSEHD